MTQTRRTWPFFSTPVWIYAIVMGPICGMAAVWLFSNSPGWMRGSAALVIGATVYGFCRGYVRRLVVDGTGLRFIRLGRSIFLPWSAVRVIGRYMPGGGVGAAEYVYATTDSAAPGGPWDIHESMIQLQDRPGLLESLSAAQREFQGTIGPPDI